MRILRHKVVQYLPGTWVMITAPAATSVTSKLQSTSKRTPSHLEHPNTIIIAGEFSSWYLISKDRSPKYGY